MAGSENGVSGVLGKLMPTQSEDSGAPKKKMSRQKARLARRDAAAAQMRADAEQEVVDENNQEAADEAKALKEACDELDVTLCELNVRYPAQEPYTYDMLRMAAARYMRQHSADFMPFISDLDESQAGVQGENTAESKFLQYCDAMESTSAWGGQPEILALSKVFHTPIHVMQPGMPMVKIGDEFDKAPLLISYHIKLFGLGEGVGLGCE